MNRFALVVCATIAGIIMYFLPRSVVAISAYTIGLLVVGVLLFAIGATRERRPKPPQYRRAEPVEPTVTAITPGRARPALDTPHDHAELDRQVMTCPNPRCVDGLENGHVGCPNCITRLRAAGHTGTDQQLEAILIDQYDDRKA